jgi:hypothetical protein
MKTRLKTSGNKEFYEFGFIFPLPGNHAQANHSVFEEIEAMNFVFTDLKQNETTF